jgi:4-amino-4-deoxy-L-arabinose transferase-like glycosyltransferase
VPSRIAAWAAFSIVVLCAVVSLSQRDLFVGDETKYGEVLREMRAARTFFVPVLNGEPYSHKPPVHFWIVYALSFVFGARSMWTFVLPSIAAFIALALVTRALARELFGDAAGPPALFFFSTFWLVWGLAGTGRMDLLFVFCLALAMRALFRHFASRAHGALFFAALWSGFAALVKGPMAPIIVLLAFAWLSFRRRERPKLSHLGALGVLLLIPALWLVPATLMQGSGYLEQLLVKQSLGRAVSSWVHKEPVWYYIAHFPADFFPWFALLVVAIVAALRRPADDARRQRLEFCLLWIAVVVVAFSALSGKLDIYVLPAIPPAAMLLGDFAAARVDDRHERAAIVGNQCILAILVVLGASVAVKAPRYLGRTPEGRLFDPAVISGIFVAMALIALSGLAVMLMRRFRSVGASSVALACAALAPLVAIVFFAMQPLDDVGSTAPLVRTLEPLEPNGRAIALYQSPFLWTRELPESYEKVRYIGARGLVEAGEPPRVVVTSRPRAHELEGLAAYERVATVRMIGKDFDVYRRR